MKRIIIGFIFVLLTAGYVYAGQWTILNMPGASDTFVKGIDSSGTNLYGFCVIDYGWHGFYYNRAGQTWTLFDNPNGFGTQITRSKDNKVVGLYYDDAGSHGFYYDGAQWTTLVKPGATTVEPVSIYGNTLIGSYTDTSELSHGFIYNLNEKTWANFDIPGYDSTWPCDIEGNTIVGTAGGRGFVYNLTTQMYTFMPQTQSVYGISGDNIVGCYASTAQNGYIYNLISQQWTILAPQGGSYTSAYSIAGNNVVGSYSDASGHHHSFIYTIPEPCSLALLALGSLLLRRRTN
jgi:hypothetical protein